MERISTEHTMTVDIAELERLVSLRKRIHESLKQSAQTLKWWSEHYQHNKRTIPLNVWKRLDRPLPKPSKTLGPVFDVWHAILRAERALRDANDDELLGKLRETATKLVDQLPELKQSDSKTDRWALVRQFVSDEIYGTFNPLTAAAVLRSEVFPERSEATPSYLAGYVVLSELNVALAESQAADITAMADRPPRLARIAPGVHSIMLYVEHLRRRAVLFNQIKEELEEYLRIETGLDTLDGRSLKPTQAVDGYTRGMCQRLSGICDECARLLLAPRQFFETLANRLATLAAGEAPCARQQITWAIVEARNALRSPNTTQVKQNAAHALSTDFVSELYNSIDQVSRQITELFPKRASLDANRPAKTHEDYLPFRQKLAALLSSLNELQEIHLGLTEKDVYPSIRDAARFQFVKMLLSTFRNRQKGESPNSIVGVDDLARNEEMHKLSRAALYDHLHLLIETYKLDPSPKLIDAANFKNELPREQAQHLCAVSVSVFECLSDTRIIDGVKRWWGHYAECYSQNRFDWIKRRHDSFEAIEILTRELKSLGDDGGLRAPTDLAEPAPFIKTLEEAAKKEASIALAIEQRVKEVTQWVSQRGSSLLLKRTQADAHELAAALWIADRIGAPWAERLEEEAKEVIAKLQRDDGGFDTVSPLYQNRGFTFYLPSASTIALLASFATRGTKTPRLPEHQRRLRRWRGILEKGLQFLLDTMVGRDSTLGTEGTENAGWYSDRHPERERIDLLATTEAVTALCRIDDALRWIINLDATVEFDVTWPDPPRGRIPFDCRLGKDQLALKAARVVDEFRARTELYARPREKTKTGSASRVFMFHGPPGTGKTFGQETIARDLGWPLVKLTISDFLYHGTDHVGRRAAEIFKQLGFLSRVCIVFDEFDEMVADRSMGKGYPLLTAAMLPLLSALYDGARTRYCAVSFTTNYLENIDQAARRKGRVDDRILLLYPDFGARILLVVDRATRQNSELAVSTVTDIAVNTALCTWPDVCRYVEQRLEGEHPFTPDRAVQPDYYGRLDDNGRDDKRQKSEELEALSKCIGEDILDEWLNHAKEWKPLLDNFVAPATSQTHNIPREAEGRQAVTNKRRPRARA